MLRSARLPVLALMVVVTAQVQPSAPLRSSPGLLAFFHMLDDSIEEKPSPFVEMDPQRSFRTEALLSYRSKVAPYAKIVGIRTTADRTFTSVQSWAEIEDFVSKTSEERVLVKVVEPWGTETIVGVTVNRIAFPAALTAKKTSGDAVKSQPAEEATKESDLNPASINRGGLPMSPRHTRDTLQSIEIFSAAMLIEPGTPPLNRGKRSEVVRTAVKVDPEALGQAQLGLSFAAGFVAQAPLHVETRPVRTSTFTYAYQPVRQASALVDEDTWFRDCIDLADRLGLLSAKPVLTSDRRQRTFALYTLYMALKDLRTTVDMRASNLRAALGKLSNGGDAPEELHTHAVKVARSFELSLQGLQAWDVQSMSRVVKGYYGELQKWDDTRHMLSFLSNVKREPSLEPR